jgi:glycosyltransferase involved in cell wall biosynthesis
VPFIVRPLGVLAAYGVTQHRPYLKKISLALVERRLIESASAVHFTSKAELAEAKALGLNCNGVVVPLGIDVENSIATVTAGRDDVPNLLYLSRIDPKKNVDSLLRAVRIALSRGAQFELNIAGSGDPSYIRRLKLLSCELEVDKYVNWLGYVEGQRKKVALGAASAFVLPSYSENFGIAVVEALAAGLPCIVSREVATSDEIGRAGAGIVVGTTPEEIAAGIVTIVGDELGRSTMKAAARKLAVDAFSLDAMGARLEDLYGDILKKARNRT